MNPSKRVEKACRHCGSLFLAKASELVRGGGQYCRIECAYRDRTKNFADRFWPKVRKTEGCWFWTGAFNKPIGKKWRYGVISAGTGNGIKTAHRLSWEMHFGPIPGGLLVCHRCDEPSCVRPDHLFLGSHADNSRDMVLKGRSPTAPRIRGRTMPQHSQPGEMNGSAKLTADIVAEIRAKYAAGGVTHIDLGKEYSVSRSLIGAILTRKAWTHV